MRTHAWEINSQAGVAIVPLDLPNLIPTQHVGYRIASE